MRKINLKRMQGYCFYLTARYPHCNKRLNKWANLHAIKLLKIMNKQDIMYLRMQIRYKEVFEKLAKAETETLERIVNENMRNRK